MPKKKPRVIWAVEGGDLPIICKDGIAFGVCWRTKREALLIGAGGKPIKFVEEK